MCIEEEQSPVCAIIRVSTTININKRNKIPENRAEHRLPIDVLTGRMVKEQVKNREDDRVKKAIRS